MSEPAKANGQRWTPRGERPSDEYRGRVRHPNFWFGWFGLAVAWVCLVVFDPLQTLRIGLVFEPGLTVYDPLPLTVLAILLGFLALIHVLALRPSAFFDEHTVMIDNPLRRWRIPRKRIAQVDTFLGYQRISLEDGRKIVCWGLEEFASYSPPRARGADDSAGGPDASGTLAATLKAPGIRFARSITSR